MKILKIALISLGLLVFTAPALIAQRLYERGVMQYDQMMTLMGRPIVLSRGTLAQLKNDANFVGDFQTMVNQAAQLLDGYTIVRRGGYFPENEGIPRDRQLTTAQVAYRIYGLDNRYELVLFRTPRTGTAQYFIRRIEEPTPSPQGAPAPQITPAPEGTPAPQIMPAPQAAPQPVPVPGSSPAPQTMPAPQVAPQPLPSPQYTPLPPASPIIQGSTSQ